MNAEHVFAGLVVSDLARSRDWYVALFGREPDVVPNDQELMWQLTPNANLYLLADTERAGGGVCAIAVDDLQEEVTAMTTRGVEIGEIEPIDGAGFKAIATDPDGNQLHLIGLTHS